jgi:purine-nucleoside phosphorylase
MPVKLETRAVKYILNRLKAKPQIAIILGSGWKIIDNDYRIESRIPYSAIPGFPTTTIAGHKGELIACLLNKTPLIILSGRCHLYEGYSAGEVVFPVKVLNGVGIKTLIITNAAGAINPDFSEGDIMIIKDQINLQFKYPGLLKKIREPLYNPYLISITERKGNNINIRKGVYIGVTGPSYETPAEIRAFRKIGADAVGMSTVLETECAMSLGIKVLGISCLVNKAAGLAKDKLEHKDVLSVMEKVKNQLQSLIKNVVLDIE